ncbi:MAG TPA: hypothetical protein VH482_19955 [Thermomicrobiales bacterium]|jgi:hypothetical protein
MTEHRRGESGEVVAIGPWQDGRAVVTATGPTTVAVMAAALTGVLAVYRGEPPNAETDEATTALPLRAEAVDLASLLSALATALLDEIDHDAYDVRAVQFDGLVRTDEGLTGWGYALAVPGGVDRTPCTVEETAVTAEAGTVTLRATVRRER